METLTLKENTDSIAHHKTFLWVFIAMMCLSFNSWGQTYCSAIGGNEYVKLKVETTGGNPGQDFTQEEPSGFPGKYFDYTNSNVVREIGETITLNLSSSSNTGNTYVYVDWEQTGDGGFEKVGSITEDCWSGPETITFTVPSNAVSGSTRMRILSGGCYANQPSDNTTCGTTGAIVSDYTVEITAPPTDDFIIESLTSSPDPLCVNDQGQFSVEVTNKLGSNIGAGSTAHPLEYSLDNNSWTSASNVNNINDEATETYSFNYTPTNIADDIPIYIRVKDGNGDWISEEFSFDVEDCSLTPEAHCTPSGNYDQYSVIDKIVTSLGGLDFTHDNISTSGLYSDYSGNSNYLIEREEGDQIKLEIDVSNQAAYLHVFINWNGNDFSASNSGTKYVVENSNSPKVLTINVPANQPEGVYRMRVMTWANIGSGHNSSTPCVLNDQGSAGGAVYDYKIRIIDNAPPPPAGDFILESLATDPSPMCVNEQGQIQVEVTNKIGSDIGTGSTAHPLEYSLDNNSWTSASNVNNINDEATETYSFNYTPSNIADDIPIYIRVKDGNGDWIEKEFSFDVRDCTVPPDANDDCSNATLIDTEGTYTGNSGDFTDVSGGHWLDGAGTAANNIENIGYYKFEANSTSVEFTACTGCGNQFSSDGIQFYVFTECGNSASVHSTWRRIATNTSSGDMSTYNGHNTNLEGTQTSPAGCIDFVLSGLTVGETYYWGVDGYNGSDCDYSLKFGDGIALPVELTSFTGEGTGRGNLLRWETASETNNDYFELESTTDGETFKTIAKIKGAGNTSSSSSYEFLDINFEKSIMYYRLRQVDFNGDATIFNIISVENTKPTHFSPNPVSTVLYINTTVEKEGIYTVSTTCLTGQRTEERKYFLEKGMNRIEMPMSQFSNGIYIMKISNEEGTVLSTQKISKIDG